MFSLKSGGGVEGLELGFPMVQLFGTAGQAKGQQDRSSFIVPGHRDNGTSSKSCHGTGRAGTAKIRDGTGRDSENPGRDAGQNKTEQKRMF